MPRRKPRPSTPLPLYVQPGTHREAHLPLPVVHYPGLYGLTLMFAEAEDAPAYLCTCHTTGLYHWMREEGSTPQYAPPEGTILRNTLSYGKNLPQPLIDWVGAQERFPFDRIPTQDGLCHRCNHTTPEAEWCHEMYAGIFKRRHGWYINLKRWEVDETEHPDLQALRSELDTLTAEWYRIRPTHFVITDETRRMDKLTRQIDRYIENLVRDEFGHRRVGDGWVSETLLYRLAQELHPGQEILRHHRPPWLQGLELDVYVPAQRLGMEYQGIQHFKPIKRWGGDSALRALQERDALKRQLCHAHGVTLIEFDYTEALTLSLVTQRIREAARP